MTKNILGKIYLTKECKETLKAIIKAKKKNPHLKNLQLSHSHTPGVPGPRCAPRAHGRRCPAPPSEIQFLMGDGRSGVSGGSVCGGRGGGGVV